MDSKKEAFLSQLQFDIGHRWPELDIDSMTTIAQLAEFIEAKNKASKWHFLRFLPVYYRIKNFLQADCNIDAASNYDLNNISKTDKEKLIAFLNHNLGTPLAFRRPEMIHSVLFILPVLFILLPLLISTYLVTALSITGWVYLSAVIGLGLTFAAFQLTAPLKKLFHPSPLLEYSKSFYVLHNQRLMDEADKELLIRFLCESAEHHYNQPFSASSELPL